MSRKSLLHMDKFISCLPEASRLRVLSLMDDSATGILNILCLLSVAPNCVNVCSLNSCGMVNFQQVSRSHWRQIVIVICYRASGKQCFLTCIVIKFREANKENTRRCWDIGNDVTTRYSDFSLLFAFHWISVCGSSTRFSHLNMERKKFQTAGCWPGLTPRLRYMYWPRFSFLSQTLCFHIIQIDGVQSYERFSIFRWWRIYSKSAASSVIVLKMKQIKRNDLQTKFEAMFNERKPDSYWISRDRVDDLFHMCVGHWLCWLAYIIVHYITWLEFFAQVKEMDGYVIG